MHLKNSLKTHTPDALDTIKALKQLNEVDRIVAGLYFYEGLTIDQIAQVVDEAVPVVRDSLRNIFSSLLPDDRENSFELDENFAVPQAIG